MPSDLNNSKKSQKKKKQDQNYDHTLKIKNFDTIETFTIRGDDYFGTQDVYNMHTNDINPKKPVSGKNKNSAQLRKKRLTTGIKVNLKQFDTKNSAIIESYMQNDQDLKDSLLEISGLLDQSLYKTAGDSMVNSNLYKTRQDDDPYTITNFSLSNNDNIVQKSNFGLKDIIKPLSNEEHASKIIISNILQ